MIDHKKVNKILQKKGWNVSDLARAKGERNPHNPNYLRDLLKGKHPENSLLYSKDLAKALNVPVYEIIRETILQLGIDYLKSRLLAGGVDSVMKELEAEPTGKVNENKEDYNTGYHEHPIVGIIGGKREHYPEYDGVGLPPSWAAKSVSFINTSNAECYAIQTFDPAMERIFPPGSYILVNPEQYPEDGETAYIVMVDGKSWFRTVYHGYEDTLILEALDGSRPDNIQKKDIRYMHRVVSMSMKKAR